MDTQHEHKKHPAPKRPRGIQRMGPRLYAKLKAALRELTRGVRTATSP